VIRSNSPIPGAAGNGIGLGSSNPRDQSHLLSHTIDTLTEHAELWMDLAGDGYITLLNSLYDGHAQWESHGLRARSFLRYLKDLHYTLHGVALGDRHTADAIDLLDGRAAKSKDRTRAWVRSAHHEGAIYLDLANDSHEVVRITHDKWECVNVQEPKFRRLMGMQPMVRPSPSDKGYQYLRELIPLESEDDHKLLIGWMLMSLFPTGPYPVLVLNGRPWSGKSTLTTLLRRLLDPHQTETMGLPAQESHLVLTASQSRIIALDNLSTIPAWASDAICRICSGTGSRIKRNYSDTEEITLKGQCAVIMNGVSSVATAPDLLSRSIVLSLPRIPAHRHVREETYWKEFDRVAPYILGWFIEALGWYLGAKSTYEGAFELPRMSDFAHLVCTCEQYWGWEDGSFLRAYKHNQQKAHRMVMDESPGAVPLLRVAEQGFYGDYESLLKSLRGTAKQFERRHEAFPESSMAAANLLIRCEPLLESAGFIITRTRRGKHRERHVQIGRP
jgi:hypothetical protein